ncbi:unnamed protein product [Pleuronectes platessa]|uniref:Uncharacterized protein n=1 Tax=Pleuronectes platessa TaxID=8262 RepID=A0A9N7Y9N7_PLEPL|nr:unnamed protein product [Pleuronectes platessa]
MQLEPLSGLSWSGCERRVSSQFIGSAAFQFTFQPVAPRPTDSERRTVAMCQADLCAGSPPRALSLLTEVVRNSGGRANGDRGGGGGDMPHCITSIQVLIKDGTRPPWLADKDQTGSSMRSLCSPDTTRKLREGMRPDDWFITISTQNPQMIDYETT